MHRDKKIVQIPDGPRQGARDKARPSYLHVVGRRMRWQLFVLHKDQSGHCVESFDHEEWFLELLLRRSCFS